MTERKMCTRKDPGAERFLRRSITLAKRGNNCTGHTHQWKWCSTGYDGSARKAWFKTTGHPLALLPRDKDLTTQLCEWFDKLKLSISSLVLSKPDIQEAVTAIPLEHLILETDSPYLNPVDIGKVQRREQGLRNMPWSLMLHAEHIAAIWNMQWK